MEFNPLQHPIIKDGYEISPYGDIRSKNLKDKSLSYKPSYHSSNGYDYALFVVKEEYRSKNILMRLFPIDEIIAMVYVPVPPQLCGKPLKVRHINGNTKDISLENLEWVEDIEIWKDITHPGVKPGMYEISNKGRIRNKNTGMFLEGTIKNGYVQFGLSDINSKHIFCLKHRLVAFQFLPNEKHLEEVNHIDGDKLNCKIKNLEWVNGSDNKKHAYLSGLCVHRCGENSHLSKHTDEQIETCCKIIKENIDKPRNIFKIIKNIYPDIPYPVIQSIMYKTSWNSISDKYFEKPILHKLSDDEIKKVKLLIDKYKNEKYMTKKVFNELKDDIPNLTIAKVCNIYYQK